MIQDIYAPNYTLMLFEGQGARHPNWGYGVVKKVARMKNSVVVDVLVAQGTLTCRAEDLEPARMSDEDLADIRAKYNLGNTGDEDEVTDEEVLG